MIKPRHQKLLEELPKNGYKVGPSAIKAGYSPMYADKNPRQIVQTALKAQAREILETVDTKDTKTAKQELASIIGMNREEVSKALKTIALNQRDYASALKVLALIAKHDLDFDMQPDEQAKVIVPVLNIGVRQPDNGSIEPHTTTSIE
jgi:hypothetical protein